ncbi:DUF411 domain-containing protein [Candidatus Woesearchaeota archaeon]|nr:MAG: DUF411 domain-containing protein [Candidatus Woesearchaeota archaeon]
MKARRSVVFLLVSLLLIASCAQKVAVGDLPTGEVVVFKSANCGCCGIYSQYLEKQGFAVTVQQVETMEGVKERFGVPQDMQSCHTTKVGDYFVEGHVPVEAIAKLVTEQPDIAGIALPGMPSGSPGMPGSKRGSWTIYAVQRDGSTSEFMTM